MPIACRVVSCVAALLVATSGECATDPVADSTPALPPEVAAFIADRELCDHFRSEPAEGSSPEEVERRTYVQESATIHCSGTDRRLSALRSRYSADAEVSAALSNFESNIEPPCR